MNAVNASDTEDSASPRYANTLPRRALLRLTRLRATIPTDSASTAAPTSRQVSTLPKARSPNAAMSGGLMTKKMNHGLQTSASTNDASANLLKRGWADDA